ncbi:MAG: hypothetical protein V1659_01620 [Candidatus Woesearchaeota archaeon]
MPENNQSSNALSEKILHFVQLNGPVIPNQIKKSVGGETTFISAILAELKERGKIKISDSKIGGSPTYYVSGQEPRLQVLAQHLNEKDRQTFELLKQKKILRDYELNTLLRFSLRKLKDFAVPLTVTIDNEKEIFWKWYLTSNKDAEELIMELLGMKNKDEKIKEAAKKEEPEKVAKPAQAKSDDAISETENTQQIFPKQKARGSTEPVHEKKEAITEIKPEKKPEAALKKTDDTSGGDFIERVRHFFEKKNIRIIEEKIIRRNSEADFIIRMPTAVGSVEYYCKAKNKAKCSEGDLSSAYLKSQLKKLPVLFITTGIVASKTKQKLNSEFRGMVVQESI